MSGPAAGRTHLVLVGATGMVGGYALAGHTRGKTVFTR
jgi:hypothetical protein